MSSIQTHRKCSKCGQEKLATYANFRVDVFDRQLCAAECRRCENKRRKPRPRTPLADRFWPRVQRVDGEGCWNWTGRLWQGYGAISLGGRGNLVHATYASWLLHYGEHPPKGAYLLHTCDNRACVRPDHLYIGTHLQNMRDLAMRERSAQLKITNAQVREIRAAYLPYKTTAKKLAERYGVSEILVRKILNGTARRHA